MLLKIQYKWILKDSRFLELRVHDAPAAKLDGRSLKSGGKKPSRRLLKPVKANSKRAAFLRWYLDSPEPGRSVGATVANFEMTRPNVIAYWFNIHRDHGIGYSLENNIITPRLPPHVTAESIFGD